MIVPIFALKFMLLIGSIEATSEKTDEKLRKKPHCNVGDEGCANDRSGRDATLTIIDYDSRHVVCDENHPFFCDIVDPIHEHDDKFDRKSLNVEEFSRYTSDRLPFDVHKQNKKNYKSPAGIKNIKSSYKSNVPNSDGFICAAYGFFPGISMIKTSAKSLI